MLFFSLLAITISLTQAGCAHKSTSEKAKANLSTNELEAYPPSDPIPHSIALEDFSMDEIDEKIYQVQAPALNVRSGPGMRFPVIKVLKEVKSGHTEQTRRLGTSRETDVGIQQVHRTRPIKNLLLKILL